MHFNRQIQCIDIFIIKVYYSLLRDLSYRYKTEIYCKLFQYTVRKKRLSFHMNFILYMLFLLPPVGS